MCYQLSGSSALTVPFYIPLRYHLRPIPPFNRLDIN